MRKLFTILSAMLVLGMVFTSCGKSDNNGNDPFEKPTEKPAENKTPVFKTANIKYVVSYSDDFLNLFNVTCTYTNMQGETKDLKIEAGKGDLVIENAGTTLPANFKMDIKVEKSENFDTYLASKESFRFISTIYPLYIIGWTDQDGKEYVLNHSQSCTFFSVENATPEDIKLAADEMAETLSYSFGGSFTQNGNEISFNFDK